MTGAGVSLIRVRAATRGGRIGASFWLRSWLRFQIVENSKLVSYLFSYTYNKNFFSRHVYRAGCVQTTVFGSDSHLSSLWSPLHLWSPLPSEGEAAGSRITQQGDIRDKSLVV
jgi:hypothetical protein